MKTITLITFAGVGLLAACADSGANYTPILDGAPSAGFQNDLAACQTLARNQFNREALGAAAMGAGAGALLGEVDSSDALGGAIAGALAGGVAGAVDVNERREAIVIECLRGRGHAVVG
ncbi:glycine zipper family protein [Thalassovita sp.]|uniref:glycine zipper family protein n=1 Tax=Thalassovita sp. TaxID=1979401 RepID=UPI0028829A00|nr:glycine zipper family protein [Thalassovita sp.]MDF1804280.1 glycine zipper family protein [Thalassovita sp.]